LGWSNESWPSTVALGYGADLVRERCAGKVEFSVWVWISGRFQVILRRFGKRRRGLAIFQQQLL
jgi:hypothetical protein